MYEFVFILVIALTHIALFIAVIPSVNNKGNEQELGSPRRRTCHVCDLPIEENITSTEEDVVFIPAFHDKIDMDLFVRSLSSTAFLGRTIVLTTQNLKPTYESKLSAYTKCGVEVVAMADIADDQFAFLKAPYEYLKASRSGFFRVMIADPTRTVFFHDPLFVFHNPNRVYGLKKSISEYGDEVSKNGKCTGQFAKEANAIYDPAIVAGGYKQLMTILDSFFSSSYTKTCMNENNLLLAWSQHANSAKDVAGMVADTYSISYDPEKVYDDGFLERYSSVNNNLLTPIVVDYKKSEKFVSSYKKICNVK